MPNTLEVPPKYGYQQQNSVVSELAERHPRNASGATRRQETHKQHSRAPGFPLHVFRHTDQASTTTLWCARRQARGFLAQTGHLPLCCPSSPIPLHNSPSPPPPPLAPSSTLGHCVITRPLAFRHNGHPPALGRNRSCPRQTDAVHTCPRQRGGALSPASAVQAGAASPATAPRRPTKGRAGRGDDWGAATGYPAPPPTVQRSVAGLGSAWVALLPTARISKPHRSHPLNLPPPHTPFPPERPARPGPAPHQPTPSPPTALPAPV